MFQITKYGRVAFPHTNTIVCISLYVYKSMPSSTVKWSFSNIYFWMKYYNQIVVKLLWVDKEMPMLTMPWNK